MPEPRDLVLGLYDPQQSREALDLERLCVQGTTFRMTFRRSTFHRRAQNYPESRIFTARLDGRLVGLLSVAVKGVMLLGKPVQAAFLFDARVHPEFRGRGIGRWLGREARAWAVERADFAYTYTLADNDAAARLMQAFGGLDAGGYSYLVYPVYRRRRTGCEAAVTGFEEVHAAMLMASPPFDLYSNPRCVPGKGGYASSWIARRGNEVAGCSAWSNRGILGEVIEAVPPSVRVARALARTWPFRNASCPHIPEAGEELRSWYLFDFFATDPGLACDLMRRVEGAALEHGIDYCYIPHDPRETWPRALRRDLPRLFAPIIPYRLLAARAGGELPRIERVYVDVRDL